MSDTTFDRNTLEEATLPVKTSTVDAHQTSFAAVPPAVLQHHLQDALPALAHFDSLASVQASEVYRARHTEIETLINSVVHEDFTAEKLVTEKLVDEKFEVKASVQTAVSRSIRVVAWNIERGQKLSGIIKSLQTHEDLRTADVLLLTELDCGMARSNNAYVAGEIACALGMNYVFAPSYLSLNKGSGLEAKAAGENTFALHGNALFSRYPIKNFYAIRLPNGKDKMRGREKRLGSQRAVVADINHPNGLLRAVSLHLDAHSSQAHRKLQMQIILDNLQRQTTQPPTIIGGDWNTSTYNSSQAEYAIVGFFRRVGMGVTHVIRNHYPYPERWFERKLFKMLERRGYDYRSLNELGAGTLHYDIADVSQFENMSEWIPHWCFWFIKRALNKAGGRCSLKLDWFAGKNVVAVKAPRVIGNLRGAAGDRLSDHDAIAVDLKLSSKALANK